MRKVKTSKRFSLNWEEILKGFLVSALTPVLVILQQSIDSGDFVFNWKVIGMTAIASGALYLLRKFIASPKVVITTRTNKEAQNLKDDLR